MLPHKGRDINFVEKYRHILDLYWNKFDNIRFKSTMLTFDFLNFFFDLSTTP